MHSLKEIVKLTGLNIHFVRSCEKKIDMLKGHVIDGKNGKKLVDSSGLIVYQNIKSLRDKELTISAINDHLNSTKPTAQNEQNNTQGHSSHNEEGTGKTLQNGENAESVLREKLHAMEKAKMEAEHRLELLENTQKLLPAGGNLEKTEEMKAVIHKLSAFNKPKKVGRFSSSKKKETAQLWEALEELL